MAQLIVKEQNIALCVVCPYCSRHYDCTAYEERDGKPVAIVDFRKAPQKCERCGSPMEPGKEAQEFQDNMAFKEGKRYGPGIGRVETVVEPVSPDADEDDDSD